MQQFRLFISIFLLLGSACQKDKTPLFLLTEPGVSYTLAEFRKEQYENVRYHLFFSLPEVRQEKIEGKVEISLSLKDVVPLIIDFRVPADQVVCLSLNGKKVTYEVKNEHIFIPSSEVTKGENKVQIDFIPADQSLNRRDEFLYTLLVPDRARTLFPCFDQPNMKSLYTLSLELPESWEAIANSPVDEFAINVETHRKTVRFKETEPLSTYLFSFVAGQLQQEIFSRNGREISIYHRENDSKKKNQCSDIANEVFDALEWLEEYTAIPYPFAKYDLIILPGFQYGGMEHTGATLYTDQRMFLNENPTLNEQLSRSSLIAHETAHMWFGDYVTMRWFDDVWTKEVFANYFASKIVEPLYPEVNHQLNFLSGYIPSSYAEDRTAGSNPVKQPLDNLQNAGLVYGNIIYNKSPVVMEMLVQTIGEESFRKGIQEYLSTYAYSNADWEGLIGILDKYTDEDLKEWSRVWIHEKGMPHISAQIENGILKIFQQDPFQRELVWPQFLKYTIYSSGNKEENSIPFTDKDYLVSVDPDIPSDSCIIIPNIDGRGYGFFRIVETNAEKCFNILKTSPDEVLRGSLLITLYENVLHHTIAPEKYIENMLSYLSHETNPLLYSMALSNIRNSNRLFQTNGTLIESNLWSLVESSPVPQFRLQAFRTYMGIAQTDEAWRKLYQIWQDVQPPKECALSENDYVQLSYLLAIHTPEKANDIISQQRIRIKNPDKIKEYDFISPSVSPVKAVRDSVFQSLLIAENRRIEPWASTALAYLNYSTRQEDAITYIRPGLEILPEVQRTGDIFFPTSWVRALLSGHSSSQAREEIDRFFADYPDFPEMLSGKIRQQADFLYRGN